MNSYNYDDEEALDMVLEFEVASDGETTDDSAEEDESEIENANGETTDDGNNDAENGIGAWMFEPLPQGRGENVGDAQPPADPARLLNVQTW